MLGRVVVVAGAVLALETVSGVVNGALLRPCKTLIKRRVKLGGYDYSFLGGYAVNLT